MWHIRDLVLDLEEGAHCVARVLPLPVQVAQPACARSPALAGAKQQIPSYVNQVKEKPRL
jgi:hypothetical protein